MTEKSVRQFGYSVKQVSDMTPFSESYLRNEIRAGNLKAKLKGRRVVITPASLADDRARWRSAIASAWCPR